MYTLALDEYGKFEKRTPIVEADNAQPSPVFIGGIIFDDRGNADETGTERKRIDAYYRAVMEEAKRKNSDYEFTYPNALHVRNSNDNAKVAVVKNIVAGTLGEFLKEGTFKGKQLDKIDNSKEEFEPRKGQYYTYIVLKGEKGKNPPNSEDVDKYLDDDWASNRYFHMVDEVIERCIFNTSFAEKNSVFYAELATRTTEILPRNSKIASEYRELRYPESKDTPRYDKISKTTTKEPLKCGDEPGSIFTLTDVNVYRTIISHKLTDENPDSIKIENIVSDSITYNKIGVDKHQQFLFLADSVCSFLSFGLEKAGSNENEWLLEIDRRMNRLVAKDKCLIYIYDLIDTKYGEALRAYRSGLYKQAIEIIIECSKLQDEASKYYSNKWFEDIKRRIISDDSRNGIACFKNAVREFYYSQLSNTYIAKTGSELYKVLEETAETLKPKFRSDEDKKYLYMLYETGMIANCHLGDSVTAHEYYKKAEQYAYCVSTEEFLRTRNILVNCYTDYRYYDEALKMSKENLKATKQLKKVMSAVPQQSRNNFFLAETKAYSQLGQVYAFKKNVKSAEKCFETALMKYKTRSANYYITLSYLLHLYLDNGMYSEYLQYSQAYFGGESTWEGQLEFIYRVLDDDNPIVSGVFALYLYVKALSHMRKNALSDELWSKLDGIEEYIQTKCGRPSWRMESHPFELIAKYMCFFAIERNDQASVEKYLGVLHNFADNEKDTDSAVKTIAQMGIAEVSNKQGDYKAYGRSIDELFDVFKTKTPQGPAVRSRAKKTCEKEKVVQQYFHFMYN